MCMCALHSDSFFTLNKVTFANNIRCGVVKLMVKFGASMIALLLITHKALLGFLCVFVFFAWICNSFAFVGLFGPTNTSLKPTLMWRNRTKNVSDELV